MMKIDNREDCEIKGYRLRSSFGEVMIFNWIEFIIFVEV